MASAIRSLLQLGALAFYIFFVVRLNGQRPKSAHYRPFRLSWMRNLVFLAVFLFVLSFISLPHLFQPSAISDPVAKQQSLCRDFIAVHDFKGAYNAIRDRSFVKKAVEEYATGGRGGAAPVKSSLSETLSPVFNFILFNTGVAFCVVPALLKLFILMFQANKPNATKEEKKELNYQWGILLPVINHITLLSALTTFTFFFYIDDWRDERCIYTSGHWYTFTANVMTFALIIGHLYSYIEDCKYSRELLLYYIGYFILYLGLGINVLRNTQKLYHDHTEANDGIRVGAICFLLFMIPVLALQYILYLFDQYQTRAGKTTEKSTKVKENKKKKGKHTEIETSQATEAEATPSTTSTSSSSSADIPTAPDAPQAPVAPDAPEPPAAPQAPEAPEAPDAPNAPDAPPAQAILTQRRTTDSAASASGDLASQIGTVKLRKASSSSAAATASTVTGSGSGGLPFAASDLTNRKSGLKKVDVAEEKRKSLENKSADPLQAVLQTRVMQLRRFIQPEVKSDSDDEFSD